MPVYVETATAPSTQDAADLVKIYADAPEWLFAPYVDAADLLTQAQRQKTLVVGRFNSRLLGAGILSKTDDAWYLSHLCVRELTRKRGVARRILEEAQRLANENQVKLILVIPNHHKELLHWAQAKSFAVQLTD
ncbi:acetyl-CoA sensor PanZ family protein [Pseudomonas sp. F1_0610]|uniref:acetyl-CoA sensor PanZ family protein n=1 Tax=Pseudomonas sp. F1_0610 TaxID=3114284 RepID=UPI0039C473B4